MDIYDRFPSLPDYMFRYMCQINTDPMKSQMGYLDVVVPPDIVDYQTSQDVVRASGQNVTLTCSATGVPLPTITWRREENTPLWLLPEGEGEQQREVYSLEGQNLTLWQLQRVHMGAYLCIASNGVPPTVSKRIMLVVNCEYIKGSHPHITNPANPALLQLRPPSGHATIPSMWDWVRN